MLYNLHHLASERNCSVLAILAPELPPREITLAEMRYLQAFSKLQVEQIKSS